MLQGKDKEFGYFWLTAGATLQKALFVKTRRKNNEIKMRNIPCWRDPTIVRREDWLAWRRRDA